MNWRSRVSRVNIFITMCRLSVAQTQTQCPATRGEETLRNACGTLIPYLCLV